MTHLPKSELVGVLAPYSINTRDIGQNWTDLGVIPSPASGFLSSAYLGNGIVIAGTSDNRVFKSVDYGVTWTDQGTVGASSTSYLSYFGNGIVILIDGIAGNQIFRSTDFGSTWTSLGLFGVVSIHDPVYVGSSTGLIGSAVSGAGGHIWFSGNNGATWADLGAISVGGIFAGDIHRLAYLEKAIAIFGDTNGRIFRSVNRGAAWISFVNVSGSTIDGLIYIGNGIVLASDGNAHIFRSIDYGVTWSDLGQIGITPAVGIGAFAYFGNGVIVAQHTSFGPGSTFVSTDYGLTWPGGSFSTSNIQTTSYLGNGIGIFGDGVGHIFRSDVSYKLDESQVNFPRIISGDLGPLGANTRLIDTVVPGTNIYTNLDKTRTLIVSVGCTCNTPVGAGAAFDIEADSAATPITLVSPTVGIATGLAAEYNIFMTTGYVGPGLNYRVNQIIGGLGVVTLDKWFEMYI